MNAPRTPTGLRRRDLHRAALWLALGAWAGAPLAGAARAAGVAPRWQRNPFTLGVASGQPRPDSVVLWTRIAPDLQVESGWDARAACAVRYEIYSDEALKHSVRSGEAMAWPSRGHAVHVRADGLAPGRSYWYRFRCGNAESSVGRTRTAPAADAGVARLRLALASCQHWEQGFFTAHREIARRDLDVVLFVGDYIYEGSSADYTAQTGRAHGTRTPHTLDQYRARHALYKSDADLQAAHAAHPWIVTLDDHEVVNDYAGDRDPAHTDPERFLQRRAAAYRAYFEHMPLAVPPQGASMRIHDRFTWGRLADLWTLDSRQHRSHHACPDPQRDIGRSVTGCAELDDPTRTMLGAEQEAWLAAGLKGAKGRWKLIGQATQVSSTGIDTPEGRQTWTDAWDGYPAARRRLLQGIVDAGATNVVSLGGDVHRHAAANLRLVPNDASSPVVASEFIGGSVTARGASQGAMARLRRNNPDVLHARGDERGWSLVEVTPDALHCEMRATPHPVAADAVFARQAAFVVQAGRAGVEPV
ncbi:MAG: hypothetical protein EOO24_32275 [Comamonadaceae bacterium]|nr:MAG: hypothetical protein EOO24_32275 [Comamonadaceae bacterium]